MNLTLYLAQHQSMEVQREADRRARAVRPARPHGRRTLPHRFQGDRRA